MVPDTRARVFFERADQIEIRFCMLLNENCQRQLIRLFFQAISRLGDGVFWYVIIALLPYINGVTGVTQAIHILVNAAITLAIYKLLKNKLVRERPYISFKNIKQSAPALDKYSFPSGHTMHAFSFAILISYYLPELSSLVWGFALLVAMSRMVLGLHYPTDVLAGASLGALIAIASLVIAGG